VGASKSLTRFIESITDRFLILAEHPNLGRSRAEDLRPGLRSFPVGDCVILYEMVEGDVVILRVIRGSRDVEAMFGR
jgi:toxin ParE1/3/4